MMDVFDFVALLLGRVILLMAMAIFAATVLGWMHKHLLKKPVCPKCGSRKTKEVTLCGTWTGEIQCGKCFASFRWEYGENWWQRGRIPPDPSSIKA